MICGGALYVLAGGDENTIILETASPSERLQWTLSECQFPDYEKDWGKKVELSTGYPRRIVACFRANADGKIEYTKSLSQAPGKEAVSPAPNAQILEAYPFSDAIDEYASARMNTLRLTEQEAGEIRAGVWKIPVARFCDRVTEAFPWVTGLILGLWAFSAGIGWLVRGFAGIPNGKDFRADDLNTVARSNRMSLDWIVITWVVSGVLTIAALATSKAIYPSTSTMGWLFGKAFHYIGAGIGLVLGFSVFAVGAMGFQTLVYRAIKRKPKKLDDEGNSLIKLGFVNALLVALVGGLLNAYTVVGDWVDALDRWSRGNGFADVGVVGLFMICLLWPWIPLLAAPKVFAHSDDE